MQKLTPEQEKALRNLLIMIETAHNVVKSGLHIGESVRNVGAVLQWLEAYHKDVKYQLPVAEPKPEQKVEAKIIEAPVVDAETKAGA